MSKMKKWVLVILSSLLMSAGWYGFLPVWFIFVGFLPMLWLENYFTNHKQAYVPLAFAGYSFVSFLLFNLISAWWLANSVFIAMLIAVTANTLLMTMAMQAFHFAHRNLGAKIGYISLPIFWLAYEHIYLFTEVSWPWLHLGNIFAQDVIMVQWYDITGIAGGSLWIIIVNMALFKVLQEVLVKKRKQQIIINSVLAFAIIILPLVVSLKKYYTPFKSGETATILVVQPGLDSYYDYKNRDLRKQRVATAISLAKENISDSIDYILFSESSLDYKIWHHRLDEYWMLDTLKAMVDSFPNLSIVGGTASFRRYADATGSPTARKFKGQDFYYDKFNTAMYITPRDTVEMYFKSKLVLGVEKIPYPKLTKPLLPIIDKFGGLAGSLGTLPERMVFKHPVKDIKAGPIICYESVYGGFVTQYIHKGANILFVLTNDGWWKKTPIYHQHMGLACLRAIENRRSVARAGFNGVSGCINPRGEILSWQDIGAKGVVIETLPLIDEVTLYSKAGDYLGRISTFMALLLMLSIFVLRRTRK